MYPWSWFSNLFTIWDDSVGQSGDKKLRSKTSRFPNTFDSMPKHRVEEGRLVIPLGFYSQVNCSVNQFLKSFQRLLFEMHHRKLQKTSVWSHKWMSVKSAETDPFFKASKRAVSSWSHFFLLEICHIFQRCYRWLYSSWLPVVQFFYPRHVSLNP